MNSFFLLKPVPITSVDSFIITFFQKNRDYKKFENADFNFDNLGIMTIPIQTMLTSVEGEEKLDFLPSLSWDAGRPNCHYIVVSKTLKSVFQQFKMPNHKWYEVEVSVDTTISEIKETRLYWMLQVVIDRDKHINYSESLFVSKPMGKPLSHSNTRILEKGEITSLEKFNELSHEAFESDMHHIYPKTLALNINYPILPHFSFGIIFNQEVKEAIEAAGFGAAQGVEFVEVDYEIVMP